MNAATLSTWGYSTEPVQTTGHRCDLWNLPASDWKWWVCSLLDSETRALCNHIEQPPLCKPYFLCTAHELWRPLSPPVPRLPMHTHISCCSSPASCPHSRGSPIVCSAVPDKVVPVWLMELTSLVRGPTHNFSSEVWNASKFLLPQVFTLNRRVPHRVSFYLVVTLLLQWISVTYCVIPISWVDKDYYRIGTGRGPKRQIPKDGHALELEWNSERLASAVASQVSKLSSVLDCD